jgi:hypothetical protein
MPVIRDVSEGLARKVGRRGFFGRGADVLFGALAGVAAGTVTQSGPAGATHVVDTDCSFPGPPCHCDKCLQTGLCAKPCIIYTSFYASGCWVTPRNVTCCDCNCSNAGHQLCGCSTDYHQDPHNCPS